MIDYSVLPGSIATRALESAVSEGFYYTVTAGMDEAPVYQELNQRLIHLETSADIHVEELQTIEQVSADLVFNVEAKEEVELRIAWLKRLYNAGCLALTLFRQFVRGLIGKGELAFGLVLSFLLW